MSGVEGSAPTHPTEGGPDGTASTAPATPRTQAPDGRGSSQVVTHHLPAKAGPAILGDLSQPEVQILRELLASESGFVSGTKLAAHLGVSRVSVWSHMGKMRAEGFVFEAVRRKGYRLQQSPPHLHPWLVEAHLRLKRPVRLIWMEAVDSTNSEAERQLAAGQEAPFVVLARRQSAGRGRFGRTWESEDSGNLYLSLGFRPNLLPSQLQTFTLWMGLNVCECVANTCRVQPRVKWPNDLLYNDRKLGGMLTEARIDADHTRDLIFGLGLNGNTQTKSWPADLGDRATCLQQASGNPIDLNHLAASLIARVLSAYERFIEGDHTQTFTRLWEAQDALRGRRIEVLQGKTRLSGIASGIDDDGSLRLALDDGSIRCLRAGEVTLAKSKA